MVPIQSIPPWTQWAWAKSGSARTTRYTPAATIVAAWSSAETGVGPSIASGSQTWSGNWADLPITARKIRAAAASATSGRSATSQEKAPVRGEQEQEREQEAHVRELGHPERLHRGPRGARAVEVEADEEVADQADQLPPGERLEQVRRQHQDVHAEEEERVVGEVPPVGAARLLVHVRDRVDLDREGDQAHHREHRDGDGVEPHADLAQPAALHQQPGHGGADGAAGDVLRRPAARRRRWRAGCRRWSASPPGRPGGGAGGRAPRGARRRAERRASPARASTGRAHPLASLASSSSVSPCRR